MDDCDPDGRKDEDYEICGSDEDRWSPEPPSDRLGKADEPSDDDCKEEQPKHERPSAGPILFGVHCRWFYVLGLVEGERCAARSFLSQHATSVVGANDPEVVDLVERVLIPEVEDENVAVCV